MELTRKNILIISPEAWGEHFLSKHHYAMELARLDNRVFFLNPPQSGRLLTHIPVDELPNLVVVNYSGLRGIRFLPSPLRKVIQYWEGRKLSSICGCIFDVVWSFDNSRFYNLTAFGECLKIAHIMDQAMDFHTREHAFSADIALGVTPGIVARLAQFNANSHLIEHGFAPEKVQAQGQIQLGTAAYSGNLLLKFIDRKLVERLILECPEIEFHFFGATGNSNIGKIRGEDHAFIEMLRHAPNVVLHGAVPRHELLDRLQNLAVLLLFYDSQTYPEDTANSHKMLEYLSTGRPVVSTPIQAYEGSVLVRQTSDPEAYIQLVREMASGNEDHEQQAAERKAFADARTYPIRIREIANLIHERGTND